MTKEFAKGGLVQIKTDYAIEKLREAQETIRGLYPWVDVPNMRKAVAAIAEAIVYLETRPDDKIEEGC